MTVHMIDTATGKYIKDVVLPTKVDEEMLPSDYIAKPIPDDFTNPYWDYEKTEWYDKDALINEQADELKQQLEELQTKLKRLSTGG